MGDKVVESHKVILGIKEKAQEREIQMRGAP
jgi:hypothetical protein